MKRVSTKSWDKPGYIIFARGHTEVLVIDHTLDGWLNEDIKRFCKKAARRPYRVYRFDGRTRQTASAKIVFSGKVRILNVHRL